MFGSSNHFNIFVFQYCERNLEDTWGYQIFDAAVVSYSLEMSADTWKKNRDVAEASGCKKNETESLVIARHGARRGA